jgi:hypothetical protein
MSFSLKQIVPWGRSFEEYVAMFSLSREDLGQRIVGCGDGPAAFNARLTRRGGRVLSVDPLYCFSADDVHRRIRETYADVMTQTRENRHEFIWKSIASVEELGRIRLAAMEEFLSDFPPGKAQGRYVAGALPGLPFADGEFEMALCSHLLFLYSEHLSEEFHVASIMELCRIASEVRIFPLLEMGSTVSRHLDGVTRILRDRGYAVAVVPVDYEFQRGGNRMMLVRNNGPASQGKQR